MSSSQDPTSPITDGTPRLDGDRVPFQHIQPVLWMYGTGFILALTGFPIMAVSPPSTATWSWGKVGFLVASLSFQPFLTIPGVLLAMHHPWGAFFRLQAERRFATPRLVGLAEVWAGLLLSGCLGILLFAPVELSSALVVLFTVCTVALAPLLALYLFDRRR